VVNRKKGGIITLADDRRIEKNLVIVEAKINDNGAISGKANVLSSDYGRLNRLRSYRAGREKFTEQYFVSQPGLQVDSLELVNLENDSLALEQHFNFRLAPVESGDYKLINLNLFSGVTKSPFISDVRFSNIDYGCKQQQTVLQQISLPAHLTIESMPRNIRMITPDTSIALSRSIDLDKRTNTLSVRLSVHTNRPVFTADEYGYVKEFYKKMVELMNEQLVLKAAN
jgi:hypothetical protein